jgi:hypothetical protein
MIAVAGGIGRSEERDRHGPNRTNQSQAAPGQDLVTLRQVRLALDGVGDGGVQCLREPTKVVRTDVVDVLYHSGTHYQFGA